MRLPKELEDAIRSGKHVEGRRVDEVYAKHLAKVSRELLDFLMARTEGPAEAYTILHFVQQAMKARYGFEGICAVSDEETGGEQ